HADLRALGIRRALARGPALEAREHEGPEGEHQRRDPVLGVVMRGAGLVAGEERRQRRRRADEVDDGDHEEEDPYEHRGDYEAPALGDRGRVEGVLMDAVSNRQWAPAAVVGKIP